MKITTSCVTVALAFSLTWAMCEQLANELMQEIDLRRSAKYPYEPVNCTRYIPANWRRWSNEQYQSKDSLAGVLIYAPLEYLIACLRAELTHTNETPPFSLTREPTIEYSIALNEVVSLGFDGQLVTKVQYC